MGFGLNERTMKTLPNAPAKATPDSPSDAVRNASWQGPRRWPGCLLLAMAMPAAAGCGGDAKKHAKAADEMVIEEEPDDGLSGVSMSSEIGGLNQEAVDRVFASAGSDLRRCLDAGSSRVEFLGGDVGFVVKIGQDGHVRHAHLEQSTLGDRTTEVCMLDALKKRSWPKPVGGETGIAQKPFSFDMPNDVRPPTDWGPDSIEETLQELAPKIDACKTSGGSFSVTMYVDTDGSVLSAGIAYDSDTGDSAVDCLLDIVKQASYPSPGSWPAKVTFSL